MNGPVMMLPRADSVPDVKTIRERMQWVVDHSPLSARALSIRAGMSEKYVQKLLEREPTRPDANAIRRVAEIAGVPSDWLLHGTGAAPAGVEVRPPAPELRVEREDTRAPAADEVPLETALFEAMDPRRFSGADFDGARAAVREGFRFVRPDTDLLAMATDLLVAARQLRMEGLPVTSGSVMARVASSKSPHVQAVEAEVSERMTREAHEAAAREGYAPDPEVEAEARARVAKTMKKRRAPEE